jgi:hypothetical protein
MRCSWPPRRRARQRARHLYEIDNVDMGTPTVYDLNKGEKLNIYDNDWLTKLIQA